MTTCNCHSYNWGIGTVPEKVFDPNDFFPFKDKTKTVCLDDCIADQIASIWSAGIWTRACCCGHNREAPSLVLHDKSDAPRVIEILKRIDPKRNWRVMCWVLCEHDPQGAGWGDVLWEKTA